MRHVCLVSLLAIFAFQPWDIRSQSVPAAKAPPKAPAAKASAKASTAAKAPAKQEAEAPAPEPVKELTLAEKLASWKGEKVTLVGSAPAYCPNKPPEDDGPDFYKEGDNDQREGLPGNRYAGRKGSAVDTQPGKYDFDSAMIIQLEDGERIVSRGDAGVAFDVELDLARKLVGQAIWANGPQSLSRPENLCNDRQGQDRVEVRNLQRLSVEAAGFGTNQEKILLRVRTDDGREAVLDNWDGEVYFDSRFHLTDRAGRPGLLANSYHTTDPRRSNPTWTAAIWRLIENGEVAINMTETQAKMACGSEIEAVGFQITANSDDVSTIYECGKWRFLVEKGKVTKYVDR